MQDDHGQYLPVPKQQQHQQRLHRPLNPRRSRLLVSLWPGDLPMVLMGPLILRGVASHSDIPEKQQQVQARWNKLGEVKS
jgi:hypothetical protein